MNNKINNQTNKAGASGSSKKAETKVITDLKDLDREEQEHLKKMKQTLDDMKAAIKKQPNVNQVVKTGMTTITELYEILIFQEKKRSMLQSKLAEELNKLSNWSPSKERLPGSRKRRKPNEPAVSSETEGARSDEEIDTDASVTGAGESDASSTVTGTLNTKPKEKWDLSKKARRKEARKTKKEAERLARISKEQEAERRKEEEGKKKAKKEAERKKEVEKREKKEKLDKVKRRNLGPEALVIKVSETLP